MDEPIWISVGVIAAIIGMGIIMNIAIKGSQENGKTQLDAAVKILDAQCEQVCALPENTMLGIRIEVPKDIAIFTITDRICAISQDEEMSCARCSCAHDTNTTLLNTSGAGIFFSSHLYDCKYEKIDTRNTARLVRASCTG